MVVATLVGNPIRILLLQPHLEQLTPNLTEKWVYSLTSGVAVTPLAFVQIGLMPGGIVPATAFALLSVAILLNIVLYRRELARLSVTIPSVRRKFSMEDRRFVGIFLVILAFQMLPLIGLWVTPGDDAKLYSLITQRVIETGGVPRDWGAYAQTDWYFEHTHLLLPGFPATIASFVFLFGSGVPETVSVVTSIFRSLTAATLYALARSLSKRSTPALLAMAVYGLLIMEPPVIWFSWGGMAELSGVSLLPIAVGGTYVLFEQEVRSWRYFLWLALVIGGMVLLHPFTFFYFLAFLVPLSLLVLWRRRFSRVLVMWLPVLLSIGLVSPAILQAIPAENSISQQYSTIPNSSWTPTFSWSMSAVQAATSFVSRITIVYGPAAASILLAGLAIYGRIIRHQRRLMAVLGLWYSLLFLLHENNPNGLLLVPFPLWYRIDSNRIFAMTSLIVALFVGLILEKVWRNIIPYKPSTRRSAFRGVIPAPLRDWTRPVAILLVFLLTAQVVLNASLMDGARTASPIREDDVEAFDWIRTETMANATFFVNWADAGTWIPSYTGRRVVMPFGVVTNYSLLADYFTSLRSFIADPGSTDSVLFLKSMGATYIYAGPARIYARPGFDPAKILATGLYQAVYQKQNVWIFYVKPAS